MRDFLRAPLSWRYAWLLLILVPIGFALRCGGAPPLTHEPDEDLFLSYFQAVQGLASGLDDFKSNADFEKIKAGPDKQADEITAFRARLLKLPLEDRQRFAHHYADLVEQTTTACKKLEQHHAKNPKIIGDQWDRYWEALQFRELIEPK